jgi:hypothetical protein
MNELQHYQSIPLGEIQNWVCPGRQIFDTVFSMSYKQDLDERIFTVSDPRSPPPDVSHNVISFVASAHFGPPVRVGSGGPGHRKSGSNGVPWNIYEDCLSARTS